MKNYIKYIAILAVGMVSCEPDLDNSIEDKDFYSNGEADFTNYVSLGNSITAGYADGALFISGQENSFPNIMATQFAKVQETNGFRQPLMNDNNGGLLLGGNQIAETRLVLAVGGDDSVAPKRLNAQPTTEVSTVLEGPFNNMGVPGIKSFHMLAEGYGNVAGVPGGVANPYFVRFASSPNTTVLSDAMATDASFFSMLLGDNDVLSYATSGGTGEDQTNNLDATTYGSDDLTDPNLFYGVYKTVVDGMVANGAKGVLMNIPDVTSLPFFTRVPNNAFVLSAGQAEQLNGYFQAVAGVFAGGLMAQGMPAADAQAFAAQYALTFNEGPNRFIIDVPASPTNPLGFKQMSQDELLLLTIDTGALAQGYGSIVLTPEIMQVLGKLQQGGTPTQEEAGILFSGVNGIDDADALDSNELASINTATLAYNQSIAALAQANDLALVDLYSILQDIAANGLPFDGGTITGEIGDAFSLDGIHLTPRGYAVLANYAIEAINSKYSASVPQVNPGAYATVTFSNNVQ